MTEAELERAVIELAHWLGYRCAHFGVGLSRKGWRTPARADAVGWPDLVLVGRGCVLYRELKVGRNRLTVEQGEWLEALEDLNAYRLVVRTSQGKGKPDLWHVTDWTRERMR